MSTSIADELAAVTTAATLEDTTLRAVFPDAPADTSAPTGAEAIASLRRRRFWQRHRRVVLAAGAVGAVLAAGFLLAGSVEMALAVAGAFVVAILIAFLWAGGDAEEDFFASYARARGLRPRTGLPTRGVPLMCAGDERECSRVLAGRINGIAASLGLYTYTEISHDSEGTEERESHDFTILHLRLPEAVAARYPGVMLGPGAGITLGVGHAIADRLDEFRSVQLESTDFCERYSLRVADGQDDIALYELFSPPFVDHLATTPRIFWQQVGSDLVFCREEHATDAAELDRFCLDASHVLRRYLEETR